MILGISWIILCFLVAFAGSDKKIGYWAVFFLSLILSPLIGLIIGLVSGEKEKAPPPPSWKCGECGFLVINLAKNCSNCNIVMTYPISAYDNVRYTCSSCKKKFIGRKSSCPHCKVENHW